MKIGQKEIRLRIKRENLPSTLPLLRCILAVVVMIAWLSDRKNIASVFFFLTGILAFFDSFLAQRRAILHQLWTILDPIADKLLINLAAIAMYASNVLPWYAVVIFLAKDIPMTIGGIVLLYKNPHIIFRMNFLNKITTLFQFLTLLIGMVYGLDPILLWISIGLTLLTLIVAFFKSPFQIIKREEAFAEFRFRHLVKLADLFTLGGVVFGFLAIVFSINNWMNLAAVVMVVAVILDYLDGKIARATRRGGSFGKELDSLADTISFGVAPTVFGFSLIQSPLAIIAYTLFLFACILRLARYNIMHIKNAYAGMPITMNGLIVPALYFFHAPAVYYPYIYLLLSVLMISTLKIKKMV